MWTDPRLVPNNCPGFSTPKVPGDGINCSTDLKVQAIMLGSRSKGNRVPEGEPGPW
ncbi:hypothetical protein PpBr36_05370 [Pyricularia pennisetigena]|uniref:hypothetical protein n=1 Tax=Pyricularia pennisetigena TaxID=1578925 RepID=UPI001154EB18|nr:hypothetical protein PpBr36_05370 [Pyricularia pennisetigena]TLS27151.1 hypothetical protein PpBr36_05370 [Pyricularia pennisetigena]